MPVHTSTIGRAASAAVSRPLASTPMAAGGARVRHRVHDGLAGTRRRGWRPDRPAAAATGRRPAGWPTPPSSGDRATLPFSRISLRCFGVGFSVRCDLSAIVRPRRSASWPGRRGWSRPRAAPRGRGRPPASAIRIWSGKPNTNTLICGADLASRARRICVAKSTTMTGAAISTAAAKNVVTSPVMTLATVPRVIVGQRRPDGLERAQEAVDDHQDGAGGEQERRRHQVVELADDRRLLQRKRVEGLRKVEAREEIDQAACGHDRRDEQRDRRTRARSRSPPGPGPGSGSGCCSRAAASCCNVTAASTAMPSEMPIFAMAGIDLLANGGQITTQAEARTSARTKATAKADENGTVIPAR